MEIIKSEEQISSLSENYFMGEYPQLENSSIGFQGKNNVLYCEKGVRIKNSNIMFAGNNSLVVFRESRHAYLLAAYLYHDSVLHIGRNNYFNNIVSITCSEQKHVFVGNNGLFSLDIVMRVADPHLIYSMKDHKRRNPSKSIFLGDSIWVGQRVLLLKGTRVASGSIIGAGAVVANKCIKSNCAVAGNPIKVIEEEIFWNSRCTHAFTEQEQEQFEVCTDDSNIFSYHQEEYIPFDQLEQNFSKKTNAEEKLRIILEMSEDKNRFTV